MEFNLADIARALAVAIPDREYFVQGETRLTYAEFVRRSLHLANALSARGLGCHIERTALARHESGQDHLALYLHNGHEYLEGLIGAYAARVAPFNVNYRYVDDELVYLLHDQAAAAIIYHSAFAPTLQRIRQRVGALRVLLQVSDESGHGLLDGAEWYEDALTTNAAQTPAVTPRPDDLYVLCTGGTTGMPKGVLWRQSDIFVAALSGASTRLGREFESMDEIVEEATARGDRFRNMTTSPLMHGAAQWQALSALTHGNAIVLPRRSASLDPADVWRTAERERVTMLQIIGDSFAGPLLDELDRTRYDLSALRIVMNGGAVLSAGAKQRLLRHLPRLAIGDGLGTSEAGATAVSTSNGDVIATNEFDLRPGSSVLSADLSRILTAGEDELGWLATSGRIPLGYFGDAAKTARTFPTIDGVRYVVAGDRARLLDDGRAELHGRDSATINSGGEKIFAEEVEGALMTHPAVVDVVVCGRPSQRWGSEVVAVVALRPDPDASVTVDDLLASAAATLARYKLPKAVLFRNRIERSPAGKVDYEWARRQMLANE
ncbi:MAG: fatty-acid-CoA ligase fadD19 [Acidimicrobiaceae bacterium]|nr:MAG: fatty-acid-CoA ligase fadD19 [Acidimicrobiaceae bacterium]